LLLDVLGWILVELLFAGGRAKVVFVFSVHASVLGLTFRYIHFANWIRYHLVSLCRRVEIQVGGGLAARTMLMTMYTPDRIMPS